MPRFERLVPILYVTDLEAELAFYGTLGFEVIYRGDEFPDFVALAHGDVQFGLERRAGFRSEDANRSIMWQFQVDDLTALVALCREHDLRYTEPELYWERMDAWEMKVWSPNGYRINLEGRQPRDPGPDLRRPPPALQKPAVSYRDGPSVRGS